MNISGYQKQKSFLHEVAAKDLTLKKRTDPALLKEEQNDPAQKNNPA